MSNLARVAVIVCAVATLFGAYRWWIGPERQIRGILTRIAGILSHDAPQQGLSALTGMTVLQQHLARDVVIEPGAPFGAITGRESVMAAASRLTVVTPALQIDFVDTKISIGADGISATVDTTVEATMYDRAGRRTVDAREMLLTFSYTDGRWAISSARALNVLEPPAPSVPQ